MNKRTQDASRSARALEVSNAVSLSRVNGVEFECLADTQKPVIVVCDPRVLFRDCFVKCLKETDDNCIVLGYPTLAEWLATAPQQSPALILLSIQKRRSPDTELLPEFSLLAQHGISAPIIILSEIEDVAFVVSILEAGARGYIPTSLSLNIALEAMHFVEAGGIFAPASSLMSRARSTPPLDLHTEDEKRLFTVRQAAVLAALRRGKANKQIAYELNMREGTVKVHIRHIMKKLKARNRTEAVVLANGLFAGTDLS